MSIPTLVVIMVSLFAENTAKMNNLYPFSRKCMSCKLIQDLRPFLLKYDTEQKGYALPSFGLIPRGGAEQDLDSEEDEKLSTCKQNEGKEDNEECLSDDLSYIEITNSKQQVSNHMASETKILLNKENIMGETENITAKSIQQEIDPIINVVSDELEMEGKEEVGVEGEDISLDSDKVEERKSNYDNEEGDKVNSEVESTGLGDKSESIHDALLMDEEARSTSNELNQKEIIDSYLDDDQVFKGEITDPDLAGNDVNSDEDIMTGVESDQNYDQDRFDSESIDDDVSEGNYDDVGESDVYADVTPQEFDEELVNTDLSIEKRNALHSLKGINAPSSFVHKGTINHEELNKNNQNVSAVNGESEDTLLKNKDNDNMIKEDLSEISTSNLGTFTDDDSTAFVDRMDLADAYDYSVDGIGLGDEISKSDSEDMTPTSSPKCSTNDDNQVVFQLFLPEKMRIILIKNLGYSDDEVNNMRPDVAKVLASKMIKRPKSGIPKTFFVKGKAIKNSTTAKGRRLRNKIVRRVVIPGLVVGMALCSSTIIGSISSIKQDKISFPTPAFIPNVNSTLVADEDLNRTEIEHQSSHEQPLQTKEAEKIEKFEKGLDKTWLDKTITATLEIIDNIFRFPLRKRTN